jgi:tRNA nucleotidyltransferase/poly(A) polymerase
MVMETPSEQLAMTILRRLQEAGHIAYLAGGCVRDRLMGRQPKDFDVATSATPEQVLRLFPRSQKVGVAFGVVLVRERASARGEPGAHVEVATFRSDGTYSDGRHPDEVHFTTPERDAQRRDFTCNGLFLDPPAAESGTASGAGRLHDFVGGRQDIAAKILRAIGEPAARFREDHLRMLRAVRFAARLEFAIDPGTRAAIEQHAAEIRSISKERIHDELAMILGHPTRGVAAELLRGTGLLAELWPRELLAGNPAGAAFRVLSALPAHADFTMALAALQWDLVQGNAPRVPGNAAELLRRDLLLSNTETADLEWLLRQLAVLPEWRTFSKATFKRLLADPRWPRLATLFLALQPEDPTSFQRQAAALQAEGAAPPAFVSGGTLIELGASPGPQFKRWLEELYDRQLNNEFADAAAALNAARALIQ